MHRKSTTRKKMSFCARQDIGFTNMAYESDNGVHKQQTCGRKQSFITFMFSIVFLGVGIAIGYVIRHNTPQLAPNANGDPPTSSPDRQNDPVNMILTDINTKRIRDNLRLYTKRPRMSGTPGGDELVDILLNEWTNSGLDSVKKTSYDVLMSYPNKTSPNKVQLLSNNDVVFQAALYEEVLTESGNNSEIIPPYNAFAAAGVAEGELVYVNYGRIEDFLFISRNTPIDITGKIVIARYGKIFRGDKVKNAQRFNASGIVMYTDPSDFNIHGTNGTYPDSWWMPKTGVQRGTVGPDGDQLTPFYPATDYAYRVQTTSIENFRIPAQPISYGDAQNLLEAMDGDEAPPDWRGKLPITYRLGPSFKNSSIKARLEVNNFEEKRVVHNVIGIIEGSTEPDRYILLGNHHDTWVFGAIDPLSGTAVLTELIRVIGDMLKGGIRPKRTIVFCAWGAEEPGLIGSTEWVEEYMKPLYERAIAYLNVDYACDYTYVLTAGTSPLLQDPLYNAAKQVPNPDPNSKFKTMYEIWRDRSQNGNVSAEPSVYYSLGSGSDMATFYQRAGVPSIDMWYTYDENKWDILSYPVYHSAYETIFLYENYIDPNYTYTKSVGQLWGVMAWNLANEDILQFDTRRYASAINSFIQDLLKMFAEIWKKNDINVVALQSAASNLTTSTNEFQKKVEKMRMQNTDALQRRIINDKLIQFERAFIDPEGLPGRRIYKHVMFAPSMYDSYSDNSFPGITDTMFEIERHSSPEKWEVLKQQVSVATYMIQSAAITLDDIGL